MAKSGGPKRNKTQVAADKKKAAELRERGKTLREISESVGVSHMQVWNDLKEVEREMLADAKESLHNQREQVLAKLRVAQVESFKAWNSSMKPKEKHSEKVGQFGLEASSTIEGQSGNAAHISNYTKSVIEEAKLLGLYVPEQQEDDNAANLVKGLANMVKKAGQEYDNG